MIKKLMQIWSEQAFTSHIVDQFVSMLESSEEMLAYSFDVITSGKMKKGRKKIYGKDKTINLTEQDIRRQILIHLSANPECNLPACLVLMSITKDAERIGDYIKNFFELRNMLGDSDTDRVLFVELFEKTGNELMDLFASVSDSFANSDQSLASESVKNARAISSRCEDIISQVLESDYSTRLAVVVVLGARYMKRIALHLANIASSVVNPMPEVDFFVDEDVEAEDQ